VPLSLGHNVKAYGSENRRLEVPSTGLALAKREKGLLLDF